MSQGIVAAGTAAAAPSSYTLNASYNPGALISVVPKEDNYPEWATELRNSLQAKQKLAFIDGTILKLQAELELSLEAFF